MEDPVQEIRGVVKGLVAARNASEQKYCMQKYFAPDASFDHVLCTVASGPNSRDNGVLPIYQWLRVISRSDIEVFHVGEYRSVKPYAAAIRRRKPVWTLRSATILIMLSCAAASMQDSTSRPTSCR